MISPAYAILMARYNCWQNESLYEAADALDDTQRTKDCGAFFGSVHSTLAHILWADRVWMNRFSGTPATGPEDNQGKGVAYSHWQVLKADRAAFDKTILSWASELDEAWLKEELTWWNTSGTRKSNLPGWKLVAHFFNHQTHHRGQAHALLTAFGKAPEATDLLVMARREAMTPH